MSDVPPIDRDRDARAGDKGEIHIPGAGTAGMAVLIISLTMLFLASIAAFLIVRYQFEMRNPEAKTPQWPPPGLPAIPNSLWLSTLVILMTSFTIQIALNAVRRDDERRLLKFLKITFGLGLLFLAMQTINWLEFHHALPAGTAFSGVYLAGFYILTALHAAHVIGGLIPLGLVIAKARGGKYSRNFHPGVRYCTIYWHFLDVIWIVLFCCIYF